MNIADECPCCGAGNLKSNPAILMPYVAYKALGVLPVRITEDWHLQDVKCGESYYPCETYTCNECGLVFSSIRFDNDEVSALYDGYRNAYNTKLRQSFEPNYVPKKVLPFLDKVEEFLAPLLPEKPSILDWGGDDGSNTPFKYRCNLHHVYDIGTNPTIAGIKISLNSATGHHYDLVVCSNVLEHVSYPMSILDVVGWVLEKDTILYVEVPFENFIHDGVGYKRHWHEHINFFTEESLEIMFEANNLEVVKKQILEASPGSSAERVFMYALRRKV